MVRSILNFVTLRTKYRSVHFFRQHNRKKYEAGSSRKRERPVVPRAQPGAYASGCCLRYDFRRSAQKMNKGLPERSDESPETARVEFEATVQFFRGEQYTSLPASIMSFFRKMLNSPWGRLIPLTGICVFAICFYAHWSSSRIAEELARKLEAAPEEQVETIAKKIGGLGEAGISKLVQAMGSQRRCVVFAARDALENEFQNWSRLEPDRSAPLNRILVRSLAEKIETFGPNSQSLAIAWTRRIMRQMIEVGENPYPYRDEIAAQCESIFQKTEGERIVRQQPQRLEEIYALALGGEPAVARAGEIDFSAAAIAAKKSRLRTTNPGDEEGFDPYCSERAGILYALHQSRMFQEKSRAGSSLQNESREILSPHSDRGETMLAARDASGAMSPTAAKAAGKIASQYTGQSHPEEIRLPELPPYTPPEIEPVENPNLPVEKTRLGQTPLEHIADLGTPDLMRLLQHPDKAVCAIAEQQLRKRDHFQDAHIALAFRLHNPNAQTRKEIIELLPKIPSVQPISWLMELLRDSDPDIRLSAITFVLTSKDRRLVQAMIERAQNDDDPRVSSLVEKLEKTGLMNR